MTQLNKPGDVKKLYDERKKNDHGEVIFHDHTSPGESFEVIVRKLKFRG